MTHIETLIMNQIRQTLENLQRTGVGYIDLEQGNEIQYMVDSKIISIKVGEDEGYE